MEAEFGCYFLKNWQPAALPRTLESLQQLLADEVRAGELPASPAVCLAPPPAPLEQCTVGALGRGSGSQVLVLESLQEELRPQVDSLLEEAEDFAGNALPQSDDEALLLGDAATSPVRTRKRTGAGFDSDSGSEDGLPWGDAEVVETPRATGVPLEASPSPPGGEEPLPHMPTPLPQMPGVNLQPGIVRASSGPLKGSCACLPAITLLAWPLWSLAMTRQPAMGSHPVESVRAAASDYAAWAREKLLRSIPDIRNIEVEDVSDGHTVEGFADGSKRAQDPNGRELKVLVVSGAFESLSPVQRQRLVHKALEEALSSGAIHSLPALRTLTPQQWEEKDCSREQQVNCVPPEAVVDEDALDLPTLSGDCGSCHR
ncbi:Bola1 [Symbiodinium natans]|uniref:Bola1 protein n=1 Tax=Symbiodinium natans TaxID=878477 RepID=A0A812UV20_9DINO|nr:Bola1 [Symbiodinium natans]